MKSPSGRVNRASNNLLIKHLWMKRLIVQHLFRGHEFVVTLRMFLIRRVQNCFLTPRCFLQQAAIRGHVKWVDQILSWIAQFESNRISHAGIVGLCGLSSLNVVSQYEQTWRLMPFTVNYVDDGGGGAKHLHKNLKFLYTKCNISYLKIPN